MQTRAGHKHKEQSARTASMLWGTRVKAHCLDHRELSPASSPRKRSVWTACFSLQSLTTLVATAASGFLLSAPGPQAFLFRFGGFVVSFSCRASPPTPGPAFKSMSSRHMPCHRTTPDPKHAPPCGRVSGQNLLVHPCNGNASCPEKCTGNLS